ncbi:unnamed protein product [Bursaphelenchus okinawaensis]|uniref:Uncharacterized protein n=1 Tax=Bursaphelenchus okinawaensis TaxID=465554 RepID=A0A811K0Y8_9BILA|nr:unnamed protein product [Bursaphelenchus okinawaensis]CAG9088208.1 unnamed protein product [Bursaphelenchus okinawaensis]
MIPFNPHPSNAPAYRNYPVKWSSLTHLVQSRRNSTTELARNANHRRSQSTSALPTGIVSDHKRRDSVGYEERCSRKSSLSSLVELKRYLPAIVQKSIPSSNMGQASQSGGKRDPQRYDQSAKQRIKRVKEVPCPTETSVSHRFEKQARKSSISHCPTIQNSNVSTLSKSIGNEPVHKYNRPTLPKPLLSSKEEEIKLVHRQIQAVQSLDQELRRVTGVSPEFVTEGQPVDLVDCDRTREEAVSATTPSTSSKAQKVVEITKETDSGSPKIPHLPSVPSPPKKKRSFNLFLSHVFHRRLSHQPTSQPDKTQNIL